MPGNVPSPPPRRKFARIGEIVRLSRLVTRKVWGTGLYGIPVGLGIATGAIRNRRDVLCVPSVFTVLFLGVTWGSGKPDSLLDFAQKRHENAKLVRYWLSRFFQTVYQGWGIVRAIFFLAALIGMYWKVNRWIQASSNKTTTPLDESTAAMPPSEVPLVVPTPSVPGTDVVAATHPSTAEPLPGPGETECGQDGEEGDSPQQRCVAAQLAIAGCAREHLAGISCRETTSGKYFLLGDDVLPGREDARSAFFGD